MVVSKGEGRREAFLVTRGAGIVSLRMLSEWTPLSSPLLLDEVVGIAPSYKPISKRLLSQIIDNCSLLAFKLIDIQPKKKINK